MKMELKLQIFLVGQNINNVGKKTNFPSSKFPKIWDPIAISIFNNNNVFRSTIHQGWHWTVWRKLYGPNGNNRIARKVLDR
jgi:hypothetical protein